MIKVVIVDDDSFIRESLKVLIGMDPEIEVTGAAGDGGEALKLLESGAEADVVLMDIRMPGIDGVEGARLIKRRYPQAAVLMLTTFDDDEYIIEALKGGASGYLLKNIPPDRIIQGIKTVHEGNMLIHPDIARKLANFLQPSAGNTSPCPLESYGLTKTEQSVVKAIAEGHSNKEIAAELFLSEGTVKNYITEILSKLGLRDRTQIAIFYLKNGR
ncbi:DNA-binding response regulator, NarL/FixJ family, contains REC and HTH domains [Paenibacillus sophorae]|uniref:DNA-binding response regulator, NarL/FixJ family, contains REC and HTH domains n=1 Tax=Paenibacillus sophorae TaxID=1333845 RepID=A0A1H8I547_9BACL|nr:response regulator transcription factor [Paenibacillus sophorae]QWU15844.1 response regulator transcription factor [Paenibacillus sophorae]SEN63176.1 DNA-binding response regulator, NarL/FixJ family, contains REC and HTH domains [Paenibacillus sophorae]